MRYNVIETQGDIAQQQFLNHTHPALRSNAASINQNVSESPSRHVASEGADAYHNSMRYNVIETQGDIAQQQFLNHTHPALRSNSASINQNEPVSPSRHALPRIVPSPSVHQMVPNPTPVRISRVSHNSRNQANAGTQFITTPDRTHLSQESGICSHRRTTSIQSQTRQKRRSRSNDVSHNMNGNLASRFEQYVSHHVDEPEPVNE